MVLHVSSKVDHGSVLTVVTPTLSLVKPCSRLSSHVTRGDDLGISIRMSDSLTRVQSDSGTNSGARQAEHGPSGSYWPFPLGIIEATLE